MFQNRRSFSGMATGWGDFGQCVEGQAVYSQQFKLLLTQRKGEFRPSQTPAQENRPSYAKCALWSYEVGGLPRDIWGSGAQTGVEDCGPAPTALRGRRSTHCCRSRKRLAPKYQRDEWPQVDRAACPAAASDPTVRGASRQLTRCDTSACFIVKQSSNIRRAPRIAYPNSRLKSPKKSRDFRRTFCEEACAKEFASGPYIFRFPYENGRFSALRTCNRDRDFVYWYRGVGLRPCAETAAKFRRPTTTNDELTKDHDHELARADDCHHLLT
jgi:hypothetical protein